MNQVWLIGSVVADVIIHIDHLPTREDDLSIQSQTMRLGGCAFNASDCFRHLQIPYHLLCPVGTGLYGDFVAAQLKKLEIPILIRRNQPNGCCYCFVEKDGERTFLSHHGTEYRFTKEMLSEFPIQKDDAIYISGLEIEETTGQVIIDFLQSKEPTLLLFAPGPRIRFISQEKWHAVLSLHPVLHLNENEALYISQTTAYPQAARFLYEQTQAPVIITLGHKGAYCFDGKEDIFVASKHLAHVRDTIGAGDSHAGMCLYGLLQKWPMKKILKYANQYAAAVVECEGGQITEERFRQLKEKEKWK